MSDSIRKVSTIFTIDDSEHNRKLKSINQQYKLTQSEIKLAGERMKGFGSNTDDLTFKQSALEKQITTLREKSNTYSDSIERASKRAGENKTKLDELGKSKNDLNNRYKEAVKVYGAESEQAKTLKAELDKVNQEYDEQKRVVDKNVDSVNRYKTEMNKTEAQLAAVQAELNKTNAEIDKNNNKWLVASEKMGQAGKTLQDVGGKMQDVGGNLTKYVSLPLMSMGTIAATEAIRFESSFAGVKKTVDGTTEQMKKLEKGIIDMSKKIPATTHEISAVAEAAGQLGIQTDNIIGFTRVMVDLGESTNLSSETASSSLAKFANITKMSQKDFNRLGSTIVDLGNKFATTEADIVAMAMRLAGAGTQIGLSESEIMGLATALSSVGIEAEMGGSAISKVMVNMSVASELGIDKVKELEKATGLTRRELELMSSNSSKDFKDLAASLGMTSEEVNKIIKSGKNLEGFAAVAGMTGEQFKKSFEEDAVKALGTFIEGLGNAEEKGTTAIALLDELGISEVRLRDSLLRAGNASELFTNAIQIGNNAWEENNALTNEASQRYETTESQLRIMKNEIAEAARSLGVQLLPVIRDTIPAVTDMVQRFADLSPKTQENIVKFGLLAMAIGPVLKGGSMLVSGAGTLLSVGSKVAAMIGGAGGVTAATTGLGTAAATAGGATGLGALTGGFGGIATAALPAAGMIAAVGLAGYGLYKGLNEEVIPEVNLFADSTQMMSEKVTDANGNVTESVQNTTVKISEETQKQISSYLTLSDELQSTTTNMYTGLVKNTDEATTKMTDTTNKMADSIIKASAKQTKDVTAEYQNMFNNTTLLTNEEQKQILQNVNNGHKERVQKTETLKKELLAIYENIKNQGGRITQDQQIRINEIMEEMKRQAVSTMSKNEAEQNVILNRLSSSSERITTEMVSKAIKQMERQRKDTVKEASQQRDEIVRQAEELKTLEGGKWAEKADKIIKEANRQYKDTVDAAEKTKNEGIKKLEGAYGDLTRQVDKNSGEILTAWGKIRQWWEGWKPESKSVTITTHQKMINETINVTGKQTGDVAYALGTSHSLEGIARINERGYEMVDLPAGSKVRNHLSSKEMVKDIAKQTVNSILGKNQGVNVTQYIQVPVASPYEVARRTKKELENMALGF
ncbi:phage tail tape measure protein [Tissierella creatinophila]|uniref:Chromosome partition protein Smc n=1 Tax=Tissierella creatinophila DSM 6911 TaxID=1123403 RepID=A0A1U7M6P2_TISCR|nr:phage tail tape measure protein [Tissierella creatinophila]OLS02879.1 chromosome partition protein Smc [Tissierella creatinophila DSM 6911]